jgi:hypothetical protein
MKTIKKLLSFFVIIASLTFVCCENEPLDSSLLNQENQPPVNSNILPVVTTASITSITSTSATSGGMITSDGGSVITSRGIVWSTTQNPTIANSNTINGTGIGNFISTISNLTTGNTYYVRAYATNANGTAYGNQISFMTTGASNLPVLTTSPITNNIYPGAISGGNITSDGGSNVTARGVVWSTSSNPMLPSNNKTVDGSGMGSFVSTIAQLQIVPGTVINLRAYATNANGTSYGNQVTFTAAVSQVNNSPALMTANINGVQYNYMKPYLYSFLGNDVIVTNSAVISGLKNLKIQGDTSDNLTFLTEINFWIPDTKWVVGTYPLTDTDFGNPLDCQVDLVLPYVGGFPDYADITGGSFTISEFNLTTRRIKGTFNITYQKAGSTTTYQITNGTFDYGLDDPHFN